MKPEYKDFQKDKLAMIEKIKNGTPRRQIADSLEEKYTLTRQVKLLISGLAKQPQEQNVEEWLADYDAS